MEEVENPDSHFSESQSYFAHSANFANARCAMYNINHFNAFGSNAINNQMSVEDDVAVHAAFGRKVTAFGMIRITWWRLGAGGASTAARTGAKLAKSHKLSGELLPRLRQTARYRLAFLLLHFIFFDFYFSNTNPFTNSSAFLKSSALGLFLFIPPKYFKKLLVLYP